MPESLFSTAKLPGSDDITRKQFGNGAILLTRPNNSSPAVSIRGYLPPGSAAEPPEKYGWSFSGQHADCRHTQTDLSRASQ